MGFNEFDKRIHPYKQHHNQDTQHFYHSKLFLRALAVNLNTSGPWQPLICYFAAIGYSRISHKCSHMVF